MFVWQEHQNFLGQDDLHGPVIASIKREMHQSFGKLYRTIVRTKSGTVHELVRCENDAEPTIAELTKVRA